MLLRPEIGLLGVAVLSVAVTAHTIPRQSGEDSNQDHPVNYQGHPKDGRYKPSRGGKAYVLQRPSDLLLKRANKPCDAGKANIFYCTARVYLAQLQSKYPHL